MHELLKLKNAISQIALVPSQRVLNRGVHNGLRGGNQVKIAVFLYRISPWVGYWSQHNKYVELILDTKNFFGSLNKGLASFLAYNKFIGFYTSKMIPRERVMWKLPKNSQMYFTWIIVIWA